MANYKGNSATPTTLLPTRTGSDRLVSDFRNADYKAGFAQYQNDLRAMGCQFCLQGNTLLVTGNYNLRLTELPAEYCYN